MTPTSARVVRGGGLELHDIAIDGPAVVTFQPGVRGVDAPAADGPECFVRDVPPPNTRAAGNTRVSDDARVVEVLPPDVATMDLGEAQRIVAGGAGLESPERFAQLADVAAAVGASVGATRVITDRGWVDHDRQIGTTGVVVAPRLYVALGISGAVQHTAGLGDPDHIVSVNTDAHCPMMQLADLAVVSDANAVLDELQRALAGDA
ncbi:MAG: electron transfer flavoprotein subunit alpha/FixB family protein [Acidimicrobiia bacterium]|nr:electron transfer flavoprotein subunit alpha/FixB family protein [Acidimicrobiia bacterium]